MGFVKTVKRVLRFVFLAAGTLCAYVLSFLEFGLIYFILVEGATKETFLFNELRTVLLSLLFAIVLMVIINGAIARRYHPKTLQSPQDIIPMSWIPLIFKVILIPFFSYWLTHLLFVPTLTLLCPLSSSWLR